MIKYLQKGQACISTVLSDNIPGHFEASKNRTVSSSEGRSEEVFSRDEEFERRDFFFFWGEGVTSAMVTVREENGENDTGYCLQISRNIV